jgi:hypothetical protein
MPLTVFTPIVYGDHPGTIGGFAKTGGFTINLTSTGPLTLVGDSDTLTDFATGGNNTLSRLGTATTVVGDALTVNGFAHSGHNSVLAGGSGEAWAAGDAVTMSGFANGGHNTVAANSDFTAGAYGDAVTMSGFAHGGGNSVTGSAAHGGVVDLYGDAGAMSGFAAGGGNTLTAATGFPSNMYGDAYTLTDFAHGGGNTLIASAGRGPDGSPITTTMYGDGHDLLGFASGGGNTLVSAQNGDEVMWGDAATVGPFAHTRANTFVFSPPNGHDTIMDFHPGRDHIDLQGFGFTGFDQLSQDFHQTTNGLDIVFDASNDILLSGINQSQLSAGDFVFT